MQQGGLPWKKTNYWLDRNRKFLVSLVKKWEKLQKDIFEKHAIDLNKEPFVDYENYSAFKADITKLLASYQDDIGVKKSEILAVFTKHEQSPPEGASKGIPTEKNAEYQKEAKKAFEDFNEEIEYAEIDLTPELEKALETLPGIAQAAISFMWKEEGKIAVVSAFPGAGKLHA
jgi:hypothetical protein